MIRKFAWLAALLLAPLLTLAAPPDVSLKDFNGKTRQVSEFLGQGKWTVVAVWSADCPICKREIFHMTFPVRRAQRARTLMYSESRSTVPKTASTPSVLSTTRD